MSALASFSEKLARLRNRIRLACESAHRPEADVRILPVTKTHPAEAIAVAIGAGFTAVGENRVQEAAQKQADCQNLGQPPIHWELIGQLQTNKAKLAAEHFDRIQSVDRIKLADILERACAETGKTLRVLMQVNAGRDPAKAGIEPEDAEALAAHLLKCPHLRLEGLMTIAPLSSDPAVARNTFANLRAIRDDLERRLGQPLPELSMGMSDDLEAAILEGATLIRVGSALFGSRG